MALDATALAIPIQAAFEACGAVAVNPNTGAPTGLQAMCLGIATAIVDHLKEHAVVTPTLLVAPAGGGPVTGTGTIT